MYFLLINSGCFLLSFPGSSAGKESTGNAGDPCSIPGLGRSTREGIGYPLQYSWAFLVAQLVKKPPAMCEIWVQSLDRKMPWRREWLPTVAFLPGEFHGLRQWQPTPVLLPGKSHGRRSLVGCSPWGH